MAAENEEKLNLVYEKIKQNSEVYLDNNQKIIDNHEQRVRTAIKIESKPEITEAEKNLATKLRSIVNGDSEKENLESLQKELSEFKSASESEKKTIYSNYGSAIDLMLEEIKSELARRKQSKKDQEKNPPRNNKKLPSENKKSTIPTGVIIVGVSVLLITLSLLLVSWRRKKGKLRKKTNNSSV